VKLGWYRKARCQPDFERSHVSAAQEPSELLKGFLMDSARWLMCS